MNIIKKFKLRRQKNFFDFVPKRNYNYELDNDGNVIVLIPRFDNNFYGKWLNKKSSKSEIKTNLDKNGSEVWLLVDGEKTVFDIYKELKKKNDVDTEQLQDRLVIFFRMLYNNGLIDFTNF